MGDVPTVQQRFTQWAAIQNEKTVQRLPGPTPEPDSALAAAASFNPDQEKLEVKQEAKQETLTRPGRNPAGNDADADHGGYVHGL